MIAYISFKPRARMTRMIDFAVKGAIFDVDDTLLVNKDNASGHGLHEKSRLIAAHEVGQRHGIIALQKFTARQAREAFLNAPVHSLEATVWTMLRMCRLVQDKIPDKDNSLLQEIMALKNKLHKDILKCEGKEVPARRSS